MADVLRETSLTESQREIVETMTTSAQLLLAQIEDVLDLSKIEANRVQIEHRPMDLGRVLSSTLKVVLPQARYKGLTMNTDLAADAAGWFYGDSHHLRQVVLNLLSNAVKFTEHGEVTLRARVVEERDTGNIVRIEVQDSGIGIPAENRRRYSNRSRKQMTRLRESMGVPGLGTTIAKQLITLMGGKIGLESEPNVGSLFWVELPLLPAQPQGLDLTEELGASSRKQGAQAIAAAKSGKVQKLRGARVLVAEDNSTNQRVAQLILESGGHTVTIVENGEAALDALERGAFDIALFDLSMPLVSGIEALKLYRFSTPKPIPILILSANVTTDTIAECERAGAAEFIPKPLRASNLLESVEQHLATRAELHVTQTPALRQEERPALAVVDTPIVDSEVLEDLRKLSNDPTFVIRLIQGFNSDTDRLRSEIIEAISTRRYEMVKDSAHALKGGSASVGATQLSQYARRIENATHESLRLKASQWIEELHQTTNRTQLSLNDWLRIYKDDMAQPISAN